jgi:hypothetical protein
MVVHEIERLKARLSGMPMAGHSLGPVLAAALDAFGVLQAACHDSEDRSVEMFAAFAFAALAASTGRLCVLTAPSLPAAHAGSASSDTTIQAGLDVVADTLASLARVLSMRLAAAGHGAQHPGDQAACREAAAEASRIYALLTGDSL